MWGGTYVRQQIVQFAKTKLAWNAKDKELAVLDVRLLLDYEHSAEAWLREEELVESGMRIAYSVPRHRQYMYSGYPSEPILAEAAASVWADIQRAGGHIPAILSAVQGPDSFARANEESSLPDYSCSLPLMWWSNVRVVNLYH